MTTAFCPGHVTCFFQPVRTGDPATTGSRGAGIRLSKGATVHLDERSDGAVRVTMDGREADCPITRAAVAAAAPGRGFDVTVENGLPVGQGFGMSAAGALAAALCACEVSGAGRETAFRAAHVAEVEGGGGLGDVSGLTGAGHQPVRVSPGLPPAGRVVDTGLRFDLRLAVVGAPLGTGKVLSDPARASRIAAACPPLLEEYMRAPSEESLFRLSRLFSERAGLEPPEVGRALRLLSGTGRSAMCMLGRSVFTTASAGEASDALGPEALVIECPSRAEGPEIVRRA